MLRFHTRKVSDSGYTSSAEAIFGIFNRGPPRSHRILQQANLSSGIYLDNPSMIKTRESKENRYRPRLQDISVIREDPELLSYRRAEPSSKGDQRQFPSTTPELRTPPPALVVMLDRSFRYLTC